MHPNSNPKPVRFDFAVRLLLAVSFSLIACWELSAQEPNKAKKTKHEIAIDQSLADYKIYVGEDSVPMEHAPVLTWNNPLAGGLGKFRTVLFLKDGQPKAVACIWGSPNRLYHEFGSLTRDSLRGESANSGKWSMEEGSRTFSAVPDAKPPAEDRRRRMIQMKQLIKRFGATELMSRKFEATRETLRLMPTPLYRYETEGKEIVDGAVFCFVHTTDPEALVVLEAVRHKDSMRWEYAFVRRTTLPVEGELDEKKVWSTDQAGFNNFNQIRYLPPSS